MGQNPHGHLLQFVFSNTGALRPEGLIFSATIEVTKQPLSSGQPRSLAMAILPNSELESPSLSATKLLLIQESH